MQTNHASISSKLAKLQAEIASGQAGALENFWMDIVAHGTPIVEPAPGSDRDLLVTFIYRNENDQPSPGLVSNLTGKMGEFEAMMRLLDTDIWYKTYLLPKDTRETYQISIDGQNIIDPLNPLKQEFPLDEDTGLGGWESSVFELPSAPPQPWFSPRPGVPAGQVIKHSFRSEILDNVYPVWIYTPPGYSKESESYGFLVMLDGFFYTNLMPAPATLDNLLAEGRLPPLVAIMIGTLYHDDTRKRDYGCYPPYLDFLTKELLPWVRQEVRLTDDPRQVAVVGASRGGLMAGYIGMQLPEVFGNVLSQSGVFGWSPEGDHEREWLARQYAAKPKVPLHFYLEAGTFETDIAMVDGFSINLLASNRHLRDVLKAKGYPFHYREFSGGHSTVIYRGTLADGLLALLGKGAGSDINQDESVQSTPKPNNRTILALSRAVHPSFALLAGCQLGVFSALRDGPLTSDQTAEVLQVDSARLRPLMVALVSAGLLIVEQGKFYNTEEANSYLAKGSPMYMGTVHDVWAMIWEAEMKTAQSIRSGVPQCKHLFDYANKPAAELETIYRGFHNSSMAYGRMLAQRIDFSSCKTLVDVGGGSGGLAIALVQEIPHLSISVVELPSVAPITQQFIEEAGVTDRVWVLSMDAVRQPLSGNYDGVVLCKVIQTLSPEDVRRLLINLWQALNPNGRIIIIGTILDDSRLSPADFATANLFFINVYDGGQAFTEGEHRLWLAEAGFKDIERVVLPDQISVITARK